MIDRADIRLVDPHAERDRRNHDGVVGGHETILHRLARLGFHARVVGFSGEAGRSKGGGDGLGGLLQGHVNDGRADGPRFQTGKEDVDAIARRTRRHAQEKIRTIEPRVNMPGRRDGEGAADILRHRGRGRRGEREHAAYVQFLRVAGELQVVWAEIVPPLGNAVCLIDHEEIDAQRFQVGEEPLVGETLGSDVEELEAPLTQGGLDLVEYLAAHRGIETGGRDAAGQEKIHLVLHERDQRRHDDGESVEEERGKLVAETLPTAGGKHSERGVTCEQLRNHGLLSGTEGRKPEALAEERAS